MVLMVLPEVLHVVAQAVNINPLPHTNADANTLKTALSIAFSILGAISVIMVTIGGIQYIGSQGDPAGTAKAKNTIIYALVGVLVAVFAVTIVQITVGRLFLK